MVGGEETSGSGDFSGSREYVHSGALHTSPSSHFRTARVCARTHQRRAAREGERNTLETGIERDEFIVFWKELAITGSNMQ